MTTQVREQSLARLAAVVLIQMIAVIICFLPLWISADAPWVQQCKLLGTATALLTIGPAGLLVLAACLLPYSPRVDVLLDRISEKLIASIYLVNLLSLAIAIVLTGGPSFSFYAPLVPIQLSAVLLLDLHLSKLREKTLTLRPLIDSMLSLVAWVAVWSFLVWRGYSRLYGSEDWAPNLAIEFGGWEVFLVAIGIILTFLTYLLPQSFWFLGHLKSLERRSS